MKNSIITLSILILSMTALQAQKETKSPFNTKSPREKEVIFLADMPPCLVGIALDYHEYLGLSKETLEISKDIVADAMKKVPEFKKNLKDLEIKLMQASQEERYADFEKLLDTIGALKKEASLFHEELVKRARKEYPKEDISKIDDFMKEHQAIFLEAAGL